MDAPTEEQLIALGWTEPDPEGMDEGEHLWDALDSPSVVLEWLDENLADENPLVYSVQIGLRLWEYATSEVMDPETALNTTLELGNTELLI